MPKVSEVIADLVQRIESLEQNVADHNRYIMELKGSLGDGWDEEIELPEPFVGAHGPIEDDDPRAREARERLARDEQNPNAFGLKQGFEEGKRAQSVVGDQEIEVVLPPVSAERAKYRREQAKQMGLEDNFPGIEATEAYVKGGPLWLYHGNREFVMSLPEELRKLMVQDVERDSPQEAHEMAHDLLKKREQAGSRSLVDMLDG